MENRLRHASGPVHTTIPLHKYHKMVQYLDPQSKITMKMMVFKSWLGSKQKQG